MNDLATLYAKGVGYVYKLRLFFRDEWYDSNQTIHLDLVIIFLTLSLRTTCTSFEGHWGDRPHGPTNPEQPSPS